MRIFAASDLHFEFHNEIDWLPPVPAPDAFDVMVLAGDIATSSYLGTALGRMRKQFPDKPIIFVAGNHEHYGKNINRDIMDGINVSNVYFLENERIDLMGYHFLGSTLWTGFDCMGEESQLEAMHIAQNSVADFVAIRMNGLSEKEVRLFTAADIIALHGKARTWLASELEILDSSNTVVVTHFPPARKYRHSQIPENLLSAYFQANCMDIMEKYQPALWIYGHNHYSDSHTCGNTQVISNQYGYPSESTGYRGDLIITV